MDRKRGSDWLDGQRVNYDFLIVGAGFAGSVCAERLAAGGARVLLVDKRAHVGGNAYDCLDSNGIMVHPYGPHIFHTNSERVSNYLSRFTDWRFYEHRVLSRVEGELYPFPLNRTSINKLYGLQLDEDGIRAYFENIRVKRIDIKNSEDLVLSTVGFDLCEKFFRGYTQKQWGLDLSELSVGVAARIPTRTNDDDRYFTDSFQYMPKYGYSFMFENMLKHKNIDVRLSTSYIELSTQIRGARTIFTGPIDEFYNYQFGKLPYRSLRFEHEFVGDRDLYQPVGTVNYPNDFNFTRITEFKHITGQSHRGSSIVKEYPTDIGDPFYPVPRPENEMLYKKYRDLAIREINVSFVGRLAQYKYYNMDQVVASSLSLVERMNGR